MTAENQIQVRNEFKPIDTLTGLAAKYISVPASIIFADTGDKRAIIFSYLMTRKGMDDMVYFTIPHLVTWCGFKPNKSERGNNKNFIKILKDFKTEGILEFDEEISLSSLTAVKVNMNKISSLLQEEIFAIIYLDEINKIREYKKRKEDEKNAYINTATLFLVFSFLRSVIYKRTNKLRYEEMNIDGLNNHDNDIAHRRKNSPEAYSNSYKNIGTELGISERCVSKVADILEEDLGLIAKETPYRVKNDTGKFYTQPAIFANAYKREYTSLLAEGKEYSKQEIENKAENIKKHNKKYRLKD